MTDYIVIEKQNTNSMREGVKITAKNLTSAKIKASKAQVFKGTVLEITNLRGETLAVKQKTGEWIPNSYFA